MGQTFHAGELAVQERTGEFSRATVRMSIPQIAADFLVKQPAIVIAGRDSGDRMWATMLTGEPGFMQAPDPRVMVVHALPPASDPLAPLVAAALPGAERAIRLTIDAVQETEHALDLHWSPAILSRYNPKGQKPCQFSNA